MGAGPGDAATDRSVADDAIRADTAPARGAAEQKDVSSVEDCVTPEDAWWRT